MRFDSQVVYPHPVLRPDVEDYEDGDFEVTANYAVTADDMSVEVSASYHLSVPELEVLVDVGTASVGILINCRDTFFREIYPLTKDDESKITIDGGRLHGEVMMVPIVYATSSIKGFSSDDFAEDFEGLKFDLAPGDFLAHEDPQVFWLEREAFEPVESIITLTTIATKTGFEWDVVFDEDQIKIEVSQELSEWIQAARNTPTNTLVLINSMYFSALQSAVEYLRDYPDIDLKWANVIRQKCLSLGMLDVDAEEPHLVVQRLLDRPVEKLAKALFREDM